MQKNDYFEQQQEKGTNILIRLLKAILGGLVKINSSKLDKNMTGGGYRLVIFFSRKDE